MYRYVLNFWTQVPNTGQSCNYPSLTDTILLVEASALIETDSALDKQTRLNENKNITIN